MDVCGGDGGLLGFMAICCGFPLKKKEKRVVVGYGCLWWLVVVLSGCGS